MNMVDFGPCWVVTRWKQEEVDGVMTWKQVRSHVTRSYDCSTGPLGSFQRPLLRLTQAVCLDTGSSYFHSILVHRAPLRGCIRRTAGRPRRRATAARTLGRPAERLSHVSRPAPKARGRVRGPIPCGEEGAGWAEASGCHKEKLQAEALMTTC